MRVSALLLCLAAPFVAFFVPAGCGSDASVEPSSAASSGGGAGASTSSTSTSSADTTSASTSGQGGMGNASGAGGVGASSSSEVGAGGTGGLGGMGQGGDGAGGASLCECMEPPECLEPGCNGNTCEYQNSTIGTACSLGVCNGQGQCVECLVGADCASLVCINNACAAASCNDAIKNGNETDVDCGGPDCLACPNGGPCLLPGDCISFVCVNGFCLMPTCQDGVKNGSETGVDCGGPVCSPCANGGGCGAPADCQSGVCMAGVCVMPSCNDGSKNGSETGVDCGGGTCPTCIDGKTCLVASDCSSNNCAGGVCTAVGYACLGVPPDPATGQGCPLLTPCTQFADCGVFQGCNQWFCNNASQCELNTLSNCFTNVGGGCASEVVFQQQDDPPTDKRFVPPDGVNFREMGAITFTITNNTATDLYLDKIPMTLEVMGGGSSFEVTSAKLYDDSGGADFQVGDFFTCLTGNVFQFPANGVLGPCAGSSFTKVPKNGGSNRFLITLAFGADKTYIAGRSYRVKIASTAGFAFKVGFNGPAFAGTMCGIPAAGYTGAWVTAQNP